MRLASLPRLASLRPRVEAKAHNVTGGRLDAFLTPAVVELAPKRKVRGLLPVLSRKGRVAARFEDLGVCGVTLRQPFPCSLRAQQAHRRTELAISLPAPAGSFVKPTQKLMPAADGELLVETHSELDRLFDRSGRIVEPPGLEL